MPSRISKLYPMRKSIFFSLLLIFTSTAKAQQVPQYSQYLQNQYMVNPGATGVYDFMAISLGGRMQWVGIEGAPKTSYVYFAAPSSKWRGSSMKRTFGKVRRNNIKVKHPTMRINKLTHAFGGQLLGDQFGPFRDFKFMGSYAIHIPLSREYALSFGTSVGLSNRSFISTNAQVLSVLTDTGIFDATYDQQAGSQGSQNTLQVDAGVYFHGKLGFFGVAANQLTKDLVKFGNRTFDFDPQMHFHVTGGYHFDLQRQRMKISPSFLVKYVNPAPVSWELSCQLQFNERYWLATSYRHKDAVVIGAGLYASNSFKIGYSFDFSTTSLFRYSAGGHELNLTFMLGRDVGFSPKF
jgi:type IX secretion system PorP/SprF family membrane protein